MNIHVQVFVWTNAFSFLVGGTAVLHGYATLNFLKNYQTVFRFIFPAAKREGSHFSTCSPTFFPIFNPTIVGQGSVSALQRRFPAQGS